MQTKTFTITIEKIIPGGYGLGRREDGLITLVRLTLPGEKILVRALKSKSTYMEAEMVELLQGAASRIKPVCPHYGRCGGCDFQHMDISTQLKIKEDLLGEALHMTMGKDAESVKKTIQRPIQSPDNFGYRQRIRLHTDNNRMGFYGHHSHDLEPISFCPLASEEINAAYRQLLSSEPVTELLKNSTSVELLGCPEEKTVTALFHFKRRLRPQDISLAEDVLAQCELISTLLFAVEGYGLVDRRGKRTEGTGLAQLRHTLPSAITGAREIEYSWEAGAFSQVNPPQNNRLIKAVLELAQANRKSRILDLYCGMGNFALPLATQAMEILGLDGQAASIRSAKNNAAAAGLAACRFEKTQVCDGIKDLISNGQVFDTIIMDPPRQGAADILHLLPQLKPKRIIYISCEPVTLCRDLKQLCDNGFEIQGLHPLDMFPQTHHLETIALLQTVQNH